MLSGAVLAGAAAAGAVSIGRPASAAPVARAAPGLIVRGVSLPSWWNGTYASPRYGESLRVMRELGFNAVSLVPTHVVAAPTGSRLLDSDQSERFDNVARAVKLARGEGLEVVLRPQLSVADYAAPAEAIDPTDKAVFFDDYRALVDAYARLAEGSGASCLVVGGGLPRLSGADHRESWLQVIATARRAFGGRLVYAAIDGEERQITFWDALDYIGIERQLRSAPERSLAAAVVVRPRSDAALADDANDDNANGDTAADLLDTLADLDLLRAISRRHRKPVLITDVGVRRVAGTTASGQGDGPAYLAADIAPQVALGETVMQRASDESDGWLAGMVLSGLRFDAVRQRGFWA